MAREKPGAHQTALITGASSGIGEALAACFARDGFNLVLVARSADKLKTLAKQLAAEHGIKAWVAPIDLSKAGSAAALAAKMKQGRHAIDVLVNCAIKGAMVAFLGALRRISTTALLIATNLKPM